MELELRAMKIDFPFELVEVQRFGCSCCGRCCRGFMVPVESVERDAIADLEDWPRRLGVEQIYLRSHLAGAAGYALAKRADGRCVFLDDDGLCLIHKRYGAGAKPVACQIYPFVFCPAAGETAVSLRFDCPAVCENEGAELAEYRAELEELAGQVVPAGTVAVVPRIYGRNAVDGEKFRLVNEAVVKILGSNAVAFNLRLHWLNSFAEYLAKIKWSEVGADELAEILDMFRTGILAELAGYEPLFGKLTGRARKLFGQYLFVLSQPSQNPTLAKVSLVRTLRERLGQTSAMTAFAKPSAELPQVWADWPRCKVGDLDESFGAIEGEVEELLTRMLVCRTASYNYCGVNLYGYDVVSGLRLMIVGVAAAGWLMRVYARADMRDSLRLSDAEKVLGILDGNLGYATALDFGPAKARLEAIVPSMTDVINFACL